MPVMNVTSGIVTVLICVMVDAGSVVMMFVKVTVVHGGGMGLTCLVVVAGPGGGGGRPVGGGGGGAGGVGEIVGISVIEVGTLVQIPGFCASILVNRSNTEDSWIR